MIESTGSAPRASVIGLFVRDMRRGMAFYRALGLEFHMGSENDTHTEAMLPGGIRLALDTIESIVGFFPSWTEPTGSHRVSLAFELDTPGEVDQWFRRLTEAGATAEVEPFDAPWGQRYAILADPDGNGVDLFAASAGV